MSKNEAIVKVHETITRFYSDLAYVAPELYGEKFQLLFSKIRTIIEGIDD